MNNVFVDLFCLREYPTMEEFVKVIGVKQNGKPQDQEYVQNLVNTIQRSVQKEQLPLTPFWQFDTRKAIELWPKEVYRPHELFPLQTFEFGPLDVQGPRMPVVLCRRAFGQDCFDVYYASASHQSSGNAKQHQNGTQKQLKPIVLPGGTWETAKKQPLQEEHYRPCQPFERNKRRPTTHCREELMNYLQVQAERERQWTQEVLENRPIRTVYMDGVFDLFHVGHLEAIRQCARLGNRVIIGVTGDKDATSYKREPIVNENDRVALVAALREVDKVICPCPLIVTKDFMDAHSIDLVVHGFANDADVDRQREFFEYPMEVGKFQRISYYYGLSTTDILNKIEGKEGESKRFGETIRDLTKASHNIPYDPFPVSLRVAIDRIIEKASTARREALQAIESVNGAESFEYHLTKFRRQDLWRTFGFDMERFPMRERFLEAAGLAPETDLIYDSFDKTLALSRFTENFEEFQEEYDRFVRQVCLPEIATADTVYYQSFPCVRVIQPGDFSIGPHSDVAYGHHPCILNCYVALTNIEYSSASVFSESREDAQDWRPLMGSYGTVQCFPGGLVTHWTTENTSPQTRVTLDFRIIAGEQFEGLQAGEAYRNGGYFRRAELADGEWVSEKGEFVPDARMGYPWTVKKL